MSYVNSDRQFIKRRPKKEFLTPEQAIIKANIIADEADHKIALALTEARHWCKVAQEYEKENQKLLELVSKIQKAKTLGDAKGYINGYFKTITEVPERIFRFPDW